MEYYRDNLIHLNKVVANISAKDKEKVNNELMTSHSPKVYLLAYSFVKDHGIAEDITQEVFIKCYKNLSK